ncbi:site-specific DNA-methyltransferase [Adhaeribacter sp. BT258]|uniref:site-specific DNA-methyltransferase (adenine-specific) n=1 Tax=Adhaeribacter terrigena TaxID=2793070 RepID=A0ABS1BXF7_9BACT|nr:site-specific DNA-methyltransferase [Adhaeribacter terrigena]MBK0401809.1 site-specific DNA-methyltransferase [Adhaeribacter terrigena]
MEQTLEMEQITAGHELSQSADIVKQNLETLKTLFPTIVKEGKIDLAELKALLGEEVETGDEYYRFTWAGKSMARLEANKPSTATLRPNKADSKDWDTTQNIFIEGDNLEVLKLLQKSYANQVKMIYIDPPYNTGRDFVYKDNYNDNLGNYLAITGQADEAGNRISTNTESDGRYHSNWLNMIYPRLKLARNLLKEDGLIFISIDDNELQNLRKVCDEIFGEENFIDNIIWKKRYGGGAKEKFLVSLHEYILVYAKNSLELNPIFIPNNEDAIKRYYTKQDEKFESRGPYRTHPLEATKSMGERKNLVYPIPGPDGVEVWPKRQWLWGKDRALEALKNNELDFLRDKDNNWSIHTKQYLKDESGKVRESKAFSIIDDVFSQHGTNEILDLFGNAQIFSFPKPTELLKKILNIGLEETNEIVIDLFSGSGSTAHSIMNLNATDGGERKFICIQLPEPTSIDSEAYKAGYKNIAEITKERLRRAGEKVKKEAKSDLFTNEVNKLDTGFKALKLDSSNIQAWDGSVENFEQNLFTAASNIKQDRSEEDVLYEILLKYGLDLAQPIEEKTIAGKKVFNIGLGALFICLADGITTDVADGIGQWKEALQPASCHVIFKDTGFTDVAKTNSIQILKRYGISDINSI